MTDFIFLVAVNVQILCSYLIDLIVVLRYYVSGIILLYV